MGVTSPFVATRLGVFFFLTPTTFFFASYNHVFNDRNQLGRHTNRYERVSVVADKKNKIEKTEINKRIWDQIDIISIFDQKSRK